MNEISDFEPSWPMPQTSADITRLAESLMISRSRLAEVIGVPTSALLQTKLSEPTKVGLQSLLDIFNRAIWMAEDEKKAASWINHGYPRGMDRGSPLEWVGKGEAEYLKNVQAAVYAGIHA